MAERLFSVEEANELIPKLDFIMGRMQQVAVELRLVLAEVADEMGESAGQLDAAEVAKRRPQAQPLMTELEQLVREIDECGGQFKGLDLGLVDFPTEINGEVVVLCWQYGEKEIGYWHSLEGGFGGRQPLVSNRPPSRYLQ